MTEVREHSLADQRWKVLVARVRGPLVPAFLATVFSPTIAGWLGWSISVPRWVVFGLLGSAVLTSYLPQVAIKGTVPVELAPPVAGRWMALNSPATRVPSHLTLGYGQSHAVDLVADPPDGSRPAFGKGHGFLAPTRFPAFGQPVVAGCAGEVVRVSAWRQDHRSRTQWWSVVWLLAEGFVREVGGPGWVIGNHVVVRRDDGVHVLYAHLRHRAVDVQVGERVTPTTRIGAVGNSGNTSEPHLHLQAMDVARPSIAAGLPIALVGVRLEGEGQNGIPANGCHMVA